MTVDKYHYSTPPQGWLAANPHNAPARQDAAVERHGPCWWPECLAMRLQQGGGRSEARPDRTSQWPLLAIDRLPASPLLAPKPLVTSDLCLLCCLCFGAVASKDKSFHASFQRHDR